MKPQALNQSSFMTRRYNRLALRERLLLLVLLCVGLLATWNSFVLIPFKKEYQLLAKREAELVSHITSLQAMEAALQPKAKSERRGKKAAWARLAELRAQQGEDLLGITTDPRTMLRRLEPVVRQESGLRLLSLDTAPAVELFNGRRRSPIVFPEMPKKPEAGKRPGGNINTQSTSALSLSKNTDSMQPVVVNKNFQTGPLPLPPLYMHGYQARLLGSFNEVVDYLSHLEELSSGFFWERIEYSVTIHPDAEVTLHFFTLSFDKYGME